MKKSKQQKPDRVKKMLWQSIRIFKRGGFTVPELLRTAPGATFTGATRWVKDLERHGIVTKIGGNPVEGQHQRFRLVAERESVIYPTVCITCNNPLHRKCIFFDPKEKKEREAEKQREALQASGQGRLAEMVERVHGHYGLPIPMGPHPERRSSIPEDLKERLERKLNGEDEEVSHDAA